MANLGTIRTAAILRADMANSGFLSINEWNANINQSGGELYGIICRSYESYCIASNTFTVVGGVGNNTITLPSNYNKFMGLQRTSGSENVTLDPIPYKERNSPRIQRPYYYGSSMPYSYYYIMGTTIYIVPAQVSGGSYTLDFIPTLSTLVNDSDSWDGYYMSTNGWHEYVVIDAAIKAMQKEESDVSVLMAQKQAMAERIIQEAADRNAGDVARIIDVSQSNGWDDDPYYR